MNWKKPWNEYEIYNMPHDTTAREKAAFYRSLASRMNAGMTLWDFPAWKAERTLMRRRDARRHRLAPEQYMAVAYEAVRKRLN